MINSRTTPFDTYKTIAVSTLKCALNDGSDRDIPVRQVHCGGNIQPLYGASKRGDAL